MSVNRIWNGGLWSQGLQWATGAFGLLPIGLAVFSVPVFAQIVPDNTLGNESSQVTPNVNIRGLPAERIDGGAVRGSALFHSFSEFNVNNGQRVYFSNPAGIADIFSRVTGSNVSNILGRLGVDGGANLFLLNPNGILFGPNAQLDIQGSFLATTGSSFKFSDGSEFSATQPTSAPLLTMSVTPGVQWGANHPGATITNRGNLRAGQDLTLAGGNLDLQGQLQAGQDLTLFAQDTVKVRDSVTNPFIASAGGKLVAQGNQAVDIFALNHPNSGFFSGGNMVLQSTNTVGGDAHYWSGGNFWIETLDGNLGNLFSPNDPVIRASGDVSFGGYTGASLHILAGGSVTITGDVTITGADPTNGLVENVTLSDGTIVAINGRTQPTLDIRAGTTAFGTLVGLTGTPSPTNLTYPTNTPDRADITINGTIRNYGGLILLTNQYQSNPVLAGGDIRVGIINVGAVNNSNGGGSITIDARRDINTQALTSNAIRSANGGPIALIAGNNIETGDLSSFHGGGNTPDRNGGAITLTANGGSIKTGNIYTSATSARSSGGRGGKITLTANGDITTESLYSFSVGSSGNGGAIALTAGGDITTNSSLNSYSSSGNGGALALTAGGNITTNSSLNSYSSSGNGGALALTAGGDITTNSSLNSYSSSGNGGAAVLKGGNITTDGYLNTTGKNGGSITIDSRGDFILNGYLATQSKGGNAGDININARDAVSLNSKAGIQGNGLYTSLLTGTGKGGDINITAGSLSVTQGVGVFSDTGGEGDAGSISIKTLGAVELKGSGADQRQPNQPDAFIYSNVQSTGKGNAGLISIEAGSLSITNGAALTSSTRGTGDAGNISIKTSGAVQLDGIGSIIFSNVEPGGKGNAGLISIKADSLSITNGAQVQTLVRQASGNRSAGEGNGGDVNIDVQRAVIIAGKGNQYPSQISTILGQGTLGQGGNIKITSGSFFLKDGAQLNSSTFGQGNAGSISIKTSDIISLFGSDTIISSEVKQEGSGQGGNILLSGASLTVDNGAKLSASTSGQGNGGGININAPNSVTLSRNGQISAETSGSSRAGSVTITTPTLSVNGGAKVSTTTTSTDNNAGKGGNITVSANTLNLFGINSDLLAETKGAANAGSLTLNPYSGNDLQVNFAEGAKVSASTASSGQGGSLNVTAPNSVTLSGDGKLSAEATNGGNAGGVTINTSRLSLENGVEISASNVSSKEGGDINLQGLTTLNLNNSKISASTQTGQAGSINLNQGGNPATSVSLNNSSILAQATEQGGNAGGVTLNTSQLSLENGAKISASNISGTSQDITLQGLNTLQLSNNSEISASTGSGKGGSVTVNAQGGTVALTGNSHIQSEAHGGQAGNLDITANQLTLRDRSSATVSSTGGGTAGKLAVSAPEVILENSAKLAATTQSGSGGDIQLQNLSSLRLRNSSEISASTVSGKGGSVSVKAPGGTVALTGNSSLKAEATDGGQAGNLDITANQLTLRDRSSATVSSTGGGTAGKLAVSAPEVILEYSAKLAATTQAGSGGDIQLQNLSSLQLNNNSEISASTQSGIGGNVSVNAQGGTVALTGDSHIQSEANGGQAGNLDITANRLRLRDRSSATVSSTGRGTAGKLAVSAPEVILENLAKLAATTQSGSGGDIQLQNLSSLQLSNHSEISASTASGRGGNVSVNAPGGTITLTDNSSLKAEATQGGQAGNLEITANQLTLREGSQATVSSSQGQAGNLSITANNLLLDEGRITAETGKRSEQGGANINLQVTDLLLLRHQSLISANATGNANGGNITISTPFVVAVPSENNDIIANAFSGDGGQINIIDNYRVFGLKPQSGQSFDTLRQNRTSDISASSQSGIQGVINIQSLSIDPSQGLTNLPVDVVDSSRQIVNGCGASNGMAANAQGEFVITGRGGLPPGPDDLQTSGAITPGWVSRDLGNVSRSSAPVEPPATRSTPPLVEAQGMFINAKGEVVLTAQTPTTTPHQPGFAEQFCSPARNAKQPVMQPNTGLSQ